jgi:hypothetical protein
MNLSADSAFEDNIDGKQGSFALPQVHRLQLPQLTHRIALCSFSFPFTFCSIVVYLLQFIWNTNVRMNISSALRQAHTAISVWSILALYVQLLSIRGKARDG